MTLRSSTERHGDFSSESVVSHLVSWVSSCVVCFVFWFCFGFWLCCLGLFWRTRGNSQTKTIRFDDRLSLERARHEHKKNLLLLARTVTRNHPKNNLHTCMCAVPLNAITHMPACPRSLP